MSFLKTNVSDCLILSQQYHNHHFYQILSFVDAVINSEGSMHAAPSIIHNKTISQPLQVKIPAKTPDMQFLTNERDDMSIIWPIAAAPLAQQKQVQKLTLVFFSQVNSILYILEYTY